MKAIFINGPPGAGKDTAALALADHGAVITKFTRPMDEAIQAYFSIHDVRWKVLREQEKDLPAEEFFGKTMREVLISFSEDWVKPFFRRPDACGQIMCKYLKRFIPAPPLPGSARGKEVLVAFSDNGFREEGTPVIKMLGPERCLLLRIRRYHEDGREYGFTDSRSWVTYGDLGVKEHGVTNGDLAAFKLAVRALSETFLYG